MSHTKRMGRPSFSHAVLKLGLVLREIYHLSLRSLQGFTESLVQLHGLDVPVPSYSLYSKRMKEIEIPKLSNRRPSHILVDASGIKVYGEGEWKVKIHGAEGHRKWMKLHIAVDADSQEIISAQVSEANVGDSTMLEEVVESCPKSVRKVTADGAYDGLPCRRFLFQNGIQGLIFPPKNAVERSEIEMSDRNNLRKAIQGFGGDEVAVSLCKKLTGYHIRSLVESAFSRFKRLFGGRSRSRSTPNIFVESRLKCWILNQMAAI